jgi:predicted RNA-binding protein with PIN domain
MTALVERLEEWAVARGNDVTVVFEQPLTPPLESSVITVAAAPVPRPNSADDEIVRLVEADAHPGDVCVATSDRVLSERVRAAGAAVYPAERLRNIIDPR